MKQYLAIVAVAAIAAPAVCAAEGADEGWQDSFPLERYTWQSKGKTRYWRLNPKNYTVLGQIRPSGGEFVLITVLDETEIVDGVETRVVEEREYEDGRVIEISRNFFAIAKETGDVYYFGEDVDEFKDGKLRSHGGAWRSGVNGARAGLFLPGEPIVGMRYYMEIMPGVAMDRAEIFETGASVETPGGTFDDCLVVTESSPLEPGDESYKRYAPNVGMIYDDGLELYLYGRRFPSEKKVEFEIPESQLPKTPARIVRELHPDGVIREVKVELHMELALYAVETMVGEQQWDVEVTNYGEVIRNTPD